MKHAQSPDRKAARLILHEIANKPVSCGPRKVDKPLLLYGAGDLGRMAKGYMDSLDIPFLFVVDASPELHREDPFWTGIKILSPQEVPNELRESALLAICIVTVPFDKVTGPLKAQGWIDVVPFYDIAEAYIDLHPLSNGWFSGTLNKNDIIGIESALYRWEDDASRAHHLQFIAWRALREEWIFDDAPVTVDNRYFIPEVLSALHDKEVFVDVGAHYGEVIIRFLEFVKNRYEKIYAIEPDVDNFAKLQSRLGKLAESERPKIDLLDSALGFVASKELFCPGLGYVSQFSQLGQIEVDIKCLDDLSIPATFIKLHVEGWENCVISGGLETIWANRPILAITSYHKRNGLWVFPIQVMACLDNYAFSFRLHSWYGTGAVIYAIPRERIYE